MLSNVKPAPMLFFKKKNIKWDTSAKRLLCITRSQNIPGSGVIIEEN